jgi:biotin carboxyl carrier protein
MEMRTYNLKIGGQSFEARIVEYSESRVIVNLNGDLYEVEIEPEQGPRSPVLIRSAPERKSARAISQRTESPQPAETPQQVESPLQVSRLSTGLVIAPIPGVVKSILVKEGDAVKEGDVVLVLEAMKMDNEISARSSGTVKTIHIGVGESVQEDQVLVDIEVK